jgi:ribA/ribD-fused uncharacterized protein
LVNLFAKCPAIERLDQHVDRNELLGFGWLVVFPGSLYSQERWTATENQQPRRNRMIAFTKVSLPFGELGNMSPHRIEYQGKRYKTAEALFQSLRFDDEEIREAIRTSPSPMTAKMIAKKHRTSMVVEPQSQQDLDNMRLVLRLKVDQNPEVKRILLATKNEEIVEDCTKRPRGSGKLWGMALVNDEWEGENRLGKLLMELRTTVLSSSV